MAEWIFVFLYAGNLYATAGQPMAEADCREMLRTATVEIAACININKPRKRIDRAAAMKEEPNHA